MANPNLPGGSLRDSLPEFLLLVVFGFILGSSAGLFALEPTAEFFHLTAARDTVQAHHFWVPWLNGHEYLIRPPLWTWLVTILFQITGPKLAVARLLSVLLAIIGVGLTGSLTRALTQTRVAAWLATAILGTTWGYLHLSVLSTADIAAMDLYLVFFWLLHRWYQMAERRNSLQWELDLHAGLMGLVLGTLILLKDSTSLVILLTLGVVYLLLHQNIFIARKLSLPHFLGGLVLIPLPWLLGASIASRNPAFVLDYLLTQPFQRLFGLGPWQGLEKNPLFYLKSIFINLLPNGLFAPFILLDGRIGHDHQGHAHAVNRRGTGGGEFHWQQWAVIWFMTGFLVYSLSSFQEPTLLLPFYPPLAMLAGAALARSLSEETAAGSVYRNTLLLVIFAIMASAVLLTVFIFQVLPPDYVVGFWKFPGEATINYLTIAGHRIDLAEPFPTWKFWLLPGPFILLLGGLTVFILQAGRRLSLTAPACLVVFACFTLFLKLMAMPILNRPVPVIIGHELTNRVHAGDQILFYSHHPDIKRVWFNFSPFVPVSSRFVPVERKGVHPAQFVQAQVNLEGNQPANLFGVAREQAFFEDYSASLRERLQILRYNWTWDNARLKELLKFLKVHPPLFNQMKSGVILFSRLPEIKEDATLLIPAEEEKPSSRRKRRRR